jgi:hypothetical protein
MFKMVADQEKRKENELVKARSKVLFKYNASFITQRCNIFYTIML